jgi:hypothetical protein
MAMATEDDWKEVGKGKGKGKMRLPGRGTETGRTKLGDSEKGRKRKGRKANANEIDSHTEKSPKRGRGEEMRRNGRMSKKAMGIVWKEEGRRRMRNG